MHNKNSAFTLSEVLITLVIIGVVSAISLLVILNYTDSLEYKTKLKKTYSVLQQAFRLAYGYDYDDFRDWEYVHSANFTQEVYQKLSKYLYVEKVCGTTNRDDCWAEKTYAKNGQYSIWFTNEGKWSSGNECYSFILNDGTNIFLDVWLGATCRSRVLDYSNLSFYVDVNGSKKPNTVGKDIFVFILTTKGIVPGGIDNNIQNCNNKNTNNNFDCTAKVLME